MKLSRFNYIHFLLDDYTDIEVLILEFHIHYLHVLLESVGSRLVVACHLEVFFLGNV